MISIIRVLVEPWGFEISLNMIMRVKNIFRERHQRQKSEVRESRATFVFGKLHSRRAGHGAKTCECWSPNSGDLFVVDSRNTLVLDDQGRRETWWPTACHHTIYSSWPHVILYHQLYFLTLYFPQLIHFTFSSKSLVGFWGLGFWGEWV